MPRMASPPIDAIHPFTAPEADARRVALLDWAETREVGALWSPDDARWATQRARAEGGDFRRARARHAAQRLGERDERLAKFLEPGPWSAGWVLLAAALGLALGVITDRLGSQQLNLLSLPLWWVLGLQMAAYVALLALALRGRRLGEAPPWRLTQRLLAPRGRGRAAQVKAHWWRLSLPLQAARVALLWHVGMIGLNLGLIAGLYLRALGMEILIGWESTYLDAAQVQRLADVLLAPAALFTGLAVPDVAPLRHGALQAPGALAATWLHLLAATVALVTLPRLMLALHAGVRSWRLARALPLAVGSGPGDLRLLVIDPQRRLAGSLLGEAGARLESPEGDRLWVTLAAAAPSTLPAPWSARALARLGLPAPPAADFDASVSAESLPANARGWPAQRRQLRALGPLWSPGRQRVWQRLLESWEAPVREREAQARELMAHALAQLSLQPLYLPEGADSQAQMQVAVDQQLSLLAQKLQELYGEDAVDGAAPSSAVRWAHRVVRPRSVARNSVLGGVLGGAATGLGADLATGGLTLGAGALVGAVTGGIAASGVTDWLNRRDGRRSASLRVEAAEAAPLLAAEVLGLWMAQIGLRLTAAHVDTTLAAQPWAQAFGAPPSDVPQQLQTLLAPACEALLQAADAAAAASPTSQELP